MVGYDSPLPPETLRMGCAASMQQYERFESIESMKGTMQSRSSFTHAFDSCIHGLSVDSWTFRLAFLARCFVNPPYVICAGGCVLSRLKGDIPSDGLTNHLEPAAVGARSDAWFIMHSNVTKSSNRLCVQLLVCVHSFSVCTAAHTPTILQLWGGYRTVVPLECTMHGKVTSCIRSSSTGFSTRKFLRS